MLKKIFAAAILAVFVLSSQIAAAAIPANWSKVQRVNSKADLAKYIESVRKQGHENVSVVLTNGLTISPREFISLCPSSTVSMQIVSNDGQNIGTRVANAYLNRNTSALSAEEKQLYNVAVRIVNEIKKVQKTESRVAMDIYYAIMSRASYLTGDMSNRPRFTTAVGALVDGKANCQGYSDAFYMLGRMCGLNVGRIGGTVKGGAHQWNTITYNDGKTYFIDATWGDDNLSYANRNIKLKSYVYFNAPIEIMQVTHSWDWSLAPTNLQPSVDFRYSYCGFWKNELARTSSPEAGMDLLAKKIAQENRKWFSVMTPYDERYNTFEKANKYFLARMKALTNRRMTYWLHVKSFGKYMFFTADIFGS